MLGEQSNWSIGENSIDINKKNGNIHNKAYGLSNKAV